MSSFYITLMSDSSSELFPSNSQCCFRNKIAKPIHLNKQEWEIALVEMIVPSQVINISEEERHFYMCTNSTYVFGDFESHKLYSPQHQGVRISIPAQTYVTPQHLIATIDESIKSELGQIFKNRSLNLTFGFSGVSKSVKLDMADELSIDFHPSLFIKLGGEAGPHSIVHLDNDNPHPFPHGVDINMGHNHLFVYSDLASYTTLGNIEAPILRVIPFDPRTKAGTNPHIHFEFLNLHYVPLAKADFDTITVNIRGDTGQHIQFVHGKSMVKLHIRPRK